MIFAGAFLIHLILTLTDCLLTVLLYDLICSRKKNQSFRRIIISSPLLLLVPSKASKHSQSLPEIQTSCAFSIFYLCKIVLDKCHIENLVNVVGMSIFKNILKEIFDCLFVNQRNYEKLHECDILNKVFKWSNLRWFYSVMLLQINTYYD